MWTEFCKIKAILDATSAKQMERGLVSRFRKVAKTFGGALKATLKGAGIGIILTLLSKLLNPINELEDRIKSLLGEGQDLNKQAERYGVSASDLAKLRVGAASAGVNEGDFSKMFGSFAEAVESAKDKIAKGEVLTGREQAVAQFTGEGENLADAFVKSLRAVAAAQFEGPEAFRQYIEEDEVNKFAAGRVKRENDGRAFVELTGDAARNRAAQDLFGERYYGTDVRRLAGVDFNQAASKAALAPEAALNAGVSRTDKLNSLYASKKAASEINAQAQIGQTVGERTVNEIARREDKALQNDIKNANDEAYANLAKAANGIAQLMEPLDDIKKLIFKFVGGIPDFIVTVREAIRNLPTWLGGKGR